MTEVDVAIIGAGPCGLYGAYYAGFRGLSVAVLDALPQPGGQLAALYPEKQIYDVAGFPSIKAQFLVDALVDQADQANPHYLLGHTAQTLDITEDAVTIGTSEGAVVTAKVVLITGGIGRFTPRRMPNGAEYEGRGVRYVVPRLGELADRDVLIVGGGDSAVDWALNLENITRSVTVVHRRPKFRAHEYSVRQLHSSTARVLTPFEVHQIHGDGQSVDKVEVVHVQTKETETLRVDEIVAALGFLTDLGPIPGWGLEMRNRRIQVDRSMRTSLPRVFAAGDIADYDGNVNLISVGFGEAALAVNNLMPLVNPGAPVVPGHSSDAE
ncbi:NAD(P)/FAD-dependent oxidoreductase [Amycolatopsis jejuensis]|uniref:NAD(P)/FAD-dependent oxidoreductase n=1 Tax=Amycolatopsis jejuensis TaxID=330084 RepID=UPI000527171C|nr:NAD(P)/FAD-dependent oxidoreductase [Amycolatopsis jejuensis]